MAASTSTACEENDEYGDLSALAAELLAADDDDWLSAVNMEDPANGNNQQSQLYGNDDDFDKNTGSTWIFPVAYEKREYQLNISRACLFTNTLVCLPTGLGKTFIASVVIYNFFRWFPRSKIIFMAPSRPLVNQQISACYDVVGIPASETAELTGRSSKEKRMALWHSKRVFFATPQTIENDILDPSFPVNSIKLVVVDEAHKAKGSYAYCKVIAGINSVNQKFRVIALSATPGRPADVVDIIRSLLIAKIEARTEQSIDVRKYTFEKTIEVVKVQLGGMAEYRDRFVAILEPHMRKLIDFGVIRNYSLSKGAMFLQHKDFISRPHPQKTEINGIFSLLVSLLSSLESLERHGIQIFLNTFVDDKNATGMKYFVSQDRNLKVLLDEMNNKYKGSNPLALSVHPLPNGDIPSTVHKHLDFGHPKYEILKERVTEYFNAGGTKLIIFCELRSTADLIYKLLLQLRPLVLPRILIGQGGAISQKDQLSVMADFRGDKVNALVTTSVCEEGIDVGEVDLVICFDVNSKNPTRFVQRIGRTGRKRNGKVIMLATEGREEENIRDLIRNKKNLNKSIHTNKEIKSSLYTHSPRLVPAAFNPKIIETKFNIPEVEEAKPVTKPKKAPAKKAVKAPPAMRSIAAHFKPVSKEKTQSTSEPMAVDEVELPHSADIMPAPAGPILSAFELCEKVKNEFVRKIAVLSEKVTEPDILRWHLEASSQNAVKFVENLIHLNETINDANLSRLDLECEGLLEKTVVEKKVPSELVEIPANTQVDEFIEVESRYGNQFTIPEQFNTPFFSSLFFTSKNEKLTPIRRAPSGPKNSAPIVKKSPAENSPLMKAFAKQRVMSTSTPVSSRLSTSIFNRSDPNLPGHSVQFQVALNKPGTSREPPACLRKAGHELSGLTLIPSSLSGTKEISQKEKTVLDFFGLQSIDDIFDGLDCEIEGLSTPSATEKAPLPEIKSKPPGPNKDTPELPTNKRKQIEEIIDSVFNDDALEVVDSSVLFEAPSKKRKVDKEETDCERSSVAEAKPAKSSRCDFVLDEIFANSNEDQGPPTPDNVVSDSSQKTQIYDIDHIFEANEDSSEMKENVQVVNTVLIVDSSPPTKITPHRPKPNIARLMKALHTSNLLHSPVTVDDSPVFGRPVESMFKSPAVGTSNSSRLTSSVPSVSMQSPVSSRVARKIVLRSDDDTASENDDSKISFALPVRRKVKKKRKLNHFFDTQAGVDGDDSSDDDEAAIEEMRSFIADDTQDLPNCTQGEVDMQAKYIQSLRSPSARHNGNFKLPLIPPIRADIFSQVPQEDDDWEMDSFVVDNEDVSEDSEVDELEMAELILKNKRKQSRLQKNGNKKRKVVRPEDSSDDEELEKMRRELNLK